MMDVILNHDLWVPVDFEITVTRRSRTSRSGAACRCWRTRSTSATTRRSC
jgi:hypothetical protein